ncbi:unnamed protein product [Peniophora sp. CBMAI 1063]|nr:unnamed protein product [Peniophora sp. CBMAI 1063]
MAPKKAATADNGKQKTLMGFFSKPAAGTPAKSQTSKPRLAPTPHAVANDSAPSSSPPSPTDPRTPILPKKKLVPSTVSSSVYSSGGSAKEPPSSDVVDVDMLSDEEQPVKSTKGKGTKRKKSVVDSDEEGSSGEINAAAYKKRQSQVKSATTSATPAKKARMSVLSDEDEDEDTGAESSFAGRLNKFKKSPKKKKLSRKSASSDDDDFVVPDDVDEEDEPELEDLRSRASSRSSRRSSATDDEDVFLDDDDEEVPKPKKKSFSGGSKKSAAAARPQLKNAAAGGSGSGSFLTAAEQRAQANKEDKKEGESPFSFLQDVRDKDGVRPGEPGYDARTLFVPKSAWAKFTPFEKQFWEIKQNHYDTVLFFQKGKFLELYEEDAFIGHREFDLKLTQRVKMSMVGVPEMSFNFWAAKFLAKGYKVGRVDQAETALGAEMRVAANKGKGAVKEDKGKDKIVRRELNKVYTNGTLVDEALLTDEQAGHCISITESTPEGGESEDIFGLCVLDSATSEFNLSVFTDDVCRTRLETTLRQLRPKEIVFTKGNLSPFTTRLLKSILPSSCLWTSLRDVEGFDYDQTLSELETLYPSDDPENPHSEAPPAIRELLGDRTAICALGSMIWYLRQLNIDRDLLTMRNFNVYDPLARGAGLALDGQTLAHIEVLQTTEGDTVGSLLGLLQRCVTPFGKRLFRVWLCAPLRDIKDITARQDAVEDLMKSTDFEQTFVAITKGLPDLERLVSRIHAKNCKVKDFLKALQSFRVLNKGLKELADRSESFKSRTVLGLLRGAPDLLPYIKNIEARFQKPEKETDDLIPVEGKDDEFDANKEEIDELESQLAKELRKLTKSTGLSLSYWHSAQGQKDIYQVETKAGEKVPREWTKSGGTKAKSRYNVPALATLIRSLKEARERKTAIVKNFKFRVFAEFDEDRGSWLRAVRVLAELDCLLGLARASIALEEPACRPTFVEDESVLQFEQLRHPVLAEKYSGGFIPNDIGLGGARGRIALLTGPNMGGKSTVMRMTATGVIMAQLGMFVPAKNARLCPVDAILTRMGAYDNMFASASTFKVELDECCKILRSATPRTLVILDELGRGTSTYDGMAIAGAVLHQLATHTLPLTFFATHYGGLTDDFAYHPNVRNMHMQTQIDDDQRTLTFLYKLVDGIATGSFGTHVATLAGVPEDVVDRAAVVSADFANTFRAKIEGRRKAAGPGSRLPLVAQADFAFLHALATGRKTLADGTDAARARDVLHGLRKTVGACLKAVDAR